MTTFTVKIECNNEAFNYSTEGEPYEIARLLRVIADKVERRSPQDLSAYETIHDINGNDVGRFALKGRKGARFA